MIDESRPTTVRAEARKVRNELYRQHILAAAEKVFADHGFEATKLQEIAELTDLSMGTIYAIFPSKQDIFSAILEERGRELLGIAERVASRVRDPLQALHALIEDYVGYFVSHPDFLRMHLRLGTSWVLTPNPESESQVHHWNSVHALQTEIFRRGIASGTFIDEDPRYLAKVFSAMDQILLAEWVEDGMKESRESLVKRLQRVCERTFCRFPHPPVAEG